MKANRVIVPVTAMVCFFGALVTAADSPPVFRQDPEVVDAQVPLAEPAPAEKTPPPAGKLAGGPPAHWIWGDDPNESYYLRKEFQADAKTAQLVASCDNEMVIWLNGKQIGQSTDWQSPLRAQVHRHLESGTNVLMARVQNAGGPSGFVLKLALETADGKKRYLVSDKSWQAATSKDATQWAAVRTLAALGSSPWGNVLAAGSAGVVAAPRGVFNVLPGFQVERLYTVAKNELGSWVCITSDDQGRLLVSDQGNKGLCRVTPSPIGSDQPSKVERLDLKITGCQGMLYAFGKLYCSVNGGIGSGFYAVEDTDGDDQFDKVTKLKAFQGGGEHGPHAVRLSPDGKSLYVIAGNHTNPPANFDASRIAPNWGEDLLLPRQWDARGHARGKLAPGGWIARTDPEGETWEMISIGYRNSYDMDFNADGELFAYDADMEWDMGSPWYRPTRVVHATSGSEFGWRSGTGKWPTYYLDSLPPAVDIGPGSPVGVEFGYGTKFPAKYQKALFICDWTFGTMYAVHLTPKGASYTATKEEFVARTPLPLTDVTVGEDGALYFTIGGRGAQSELFRVTYVGDQSTEPVDAKNQEFAELRQLRKEIEQYHDPKYMSARPQTAVRYLASMLNHEDRHIRYAARVGLERRNGLAKVTPEGPDGVIQWVAALAKSKQQRQLATDALASLDFEKLTQRQQLDYLRALALVFIRHGQPARVTQQTFLEKLDAKFPCDSLDLNRELSRVLVYLNSPTVISKTLELMEQESQAKPEDIAELLARNLRYGGTIAKMLANYPNQQKIHYALVLRNMRYGWTLGERKRYFKILAHLRTKSGGASYQGFIDNIRKEALANASEAERVAIASEIDLTPIPTAQLPKPVGPGRKWTVDEIDRLTAGGLSDRSFEAGKRTFAAARCVVCHRFDGDGGATGPDLTNVAGRFGFRDLAESLIEPSKVISDQYRGSIVATVQGKIYSGRLAGEDKNKITILTDPEDATKVVEINKDDVEEIMPSKKSLMPDELLNTLNEQEVLDLIAYLMSRGNPDEPMFTQ